MTITTITIDTVVAAPIARVWAAWTTPADIMQWNAASDDWHTTASTVDLRVGGAFSSRMEAKDGSAGFDFAGTYSVVEAPHRLVFGFGDRHVEVTFAEEADGVRVRETFVPEREHPIEMQRAGWQAILDRFKQHVEQQA